MSFDAAVIGAGIVGAACAERLSSDGLRVVVIDSQPAIACGTTAAGMGHLVVMDDSKAQFALTSYSRDLWNGLAPGLPRSCEFERCGTVWVAADQVEMDEVRRKHAYYTTRGERCEILDERSIYDAEPRLRKGLAGGMLVPDDSVVYQPCATRFLVDRAIANGSELRLGVKVSAITDDGITLANGEAVKARVIVNAAGAGATPLTDDLPIRKRKGHLLITERYPKLISHQLIELGYLKSAHGSDGDSVAFNLQPRGTGQILLGSSRQYDVDDGAIDHAILRRMIRRALEYVPDLKNFAAVRAWTGFRPATPDNLPYIGRHPGYENVFVAAGHEGLGITTSLATGAIVADMIAGRTPKLNCEPYSPARFA